MTEQPAPYGEPAAPQPTSTYAAWGDRVIATLWDVVYLWPIYLLLLGSVIPLVAGIVMLDEDSDSGTGIALLVLGGLLYVVALVWGLVRQVLNQVVRQGRTGQTWGKARRGLWVVQAGTGQPPGWPSCLGRYFLHQIINSVFMIDYLWPLWDERKQTLTDKILDTVVVKRTA